MAGLEADKTNHFLQVLAKAAIQQKDMPTTSTVPQQKDPLVAGKKTQQDTKKSSGKQEKVTKKSSDKTQKTGAVKEKDESAVGHKTRDRKEAQPHHERDNRENESSEVAADGKTSDEGKTEDTSGLLAGPRDSKGTVNPGSHFPVSKKVPNRNVTLDCFP